MVDLSRNRGGYAIIGNDVDEAILKMVELDGKLVIIKENSIHEFFFADPKRKIATSSNHIQQPKLLYGASSETVARTFLTAALLFDKQYLTNNIESQKVLAFAFELVQELIELETEVIRYSSDCESAIEPSRQISSDTLPWIESLETRCRTMFQKADHVKQALIEIAVLFYPGNLTKQSQFGTLTEVIVAKYGQADPFSQFLNKNAPFMRLIAAIRNCLDHRLNDKISIQNFIQEAEQILAPTIELDYRDEKLPQTDLSELLQSLVPILISTVEGAFVCLASRHLKDGFPFFEVRELPEVIRRYEFLRFSIWTPTPFSDEGFYHQR